MHRYGMSIAALTLGADRKSTRLNSSHRYISYAVFCLKKKKERIQPPRARLSIVVALRSTARLQPSQYFALTDRQVCQAAGLMTPHQPLLGPPQLPQL